MEKGSLEEPEKLDEEGMLDDLDGFPDQVGEAVDLAKDLDGIPDLGGAKKVCVTGMGGSAIVGDLLDYFIEPETLVNRGYDLPAPLAENDLLIVVSYSGNTEETLSATEEGYENGLDLICISTGGQLEEFCEKRELPFISIPGGCQPRASTGYMLFPLVELFRKEGLAEDFDYGSLLSALERKKDKYGTNSKTEENPAKRLAKELKGRIPLIYGTKKNNGTVAYRWKTQFNENAKQPAFWNVFPELNHNETVGYQLSDRLMDNVFVLMLKNGLEGERNSVRIEVMKEILEDRDIPYRVVENPKGDRFERILGQMYLGDYVSTYLALLNGKDPSPVNLIEKFKKKMRKRTI